MATKKKAKPLKLAIWNQRVIKIMEEAVLYGKVKTKRDFLKSIGFHPENLRQVENGKQSFRLEHLHKLAMRYNVNINWLFGLDNEVNRKPVKDVLQQLRDAVVAVEEKYG